MPARITAELRVKKTHMRSVLMIPLMKEGSHLRLREWLQKSCALHKRAATVGALRCPRPGAADRGLVDIGVRACVVGPARYDEENKIVHIGKAAAVVWVE